MNNRSLNKPIITLLTDFGYQNPYVGIMKGVILGICSEVKIIDLTHGVTKFGVKQGAFLLSQTAPYFPNGTIHVVVIDPGVGTNRRRLIIEGTRSLYVGPDNGVLSLAVRREGLVKAVEISEKKFISPKLSTTFEGRDIFAPASAHLALGVKIEEFGPEVSNPIQLNFPEAIVEKDRIIGSVLYIDCFGNIITNVNSTHLQEINAIMGELVEIKINGTSKKLRYLKAYAQVPVNTFLMVIGSSDFLEISINQGSAKDMLKVDYSTRIEITK